MAVASYKCQMAILSCVHRHNWMTSKDVSDKSGYQQPATTTALRNLEVKGFVQARPRQDTQNGTGFLWRLTDAGWIRLRKELGETDAMPQAPVHTVDEDRVDALDEPPPDRKLTTDQKIQECRKILEKTQQRLDRLLQRQAEEDRAREAAVEKDPFFQRILAKKIQEHLDALTSPPESPREST